MTKAMMFRWVAWAAMVASSCAAALPLTVPHTAFTASPWSTFAWTEQKVVASDASMDASFAYGVSIDGDTAVVGASNAGAGAAYVFTRTAGVWTQQQILTADDGVAADGFGFSVSVSGDEVIVGAPYATVGTNGGEGAAYVFTRTAGAWTQVKKLVPDDGTSNFNFGWSVALDGANAIISAPSAFVSGNVLQGKAYVFSAVGGVWAQGPTLLASDGSASASFGYSVALDGTTAVIGAQGVSSYIGAAYVFDGTGGTWMQTGELVPDDGVAVEFFGISVSVSGPTALVGAYNQRVNGHNGQGSAYVFGESGGVWSQQQKLIASDGAAGARFGLSVALEGDSALIGSYTATVGGNPQQGAAYVFSQSGGTWTETDKLVASDGASGDHFGNAVALSATTAMVGAFDVAVDTNTGAGATYLFAPMVDDTIFNDGFEGAAP